MNPAPIDAAAWSEIGNILTKVWVVVLLVVVLATNMLIGHNIIPSLVASDYLPSIWQRTRPIFYALALVCLVIALVFLAQVVGLTNGALRMFWENFWI